MHRTLDFTLTVFTCSFAILFALISGAGSCRAAGLPAPRPQVSASNTTAGIISYAENGKAFFTATTPFLNPDPVRDGFFGFRVALSTDGNTALVGSPGATVNGHRLAGKVYVLVRNNNAWSTTPVASFIAPTPAENDEFGFSVALSADGTTAFIGACCTAVGGQAAAGAGYIFEKTNGVWGTQPAAILTEPVPGTNHHFGNSVAVTDTTALIGSPGTDQSSGAAYLFVQSGGVWNTTPATTFTEPATTPGNLFGVVVALSASGEIALVGSPMAALSGGNEAGKAYLFTSTNGFWNTAPVAVLPDPGMALNRFGDSSLAVTDNAALLGAPNATVGGQARAGAASLFLLTGGVWSVTPVVTFTEPEPTADHQFGAAVALSADDSSLLVGVPMNDAGSAYLYLQTEGVWSVVPAAHLSEPDPVGGDQFGTHLALSGNGHMAFVGAPGVAVAGNFSAGAAYAVGLSSTDLLALTITGAPSTFEAGDQIKYAFTVVNHDSLTPATNLILTDTLPNGATFAASEAAGGQCGVAGKVVTCTLASLAPQTKWQPVLTVTTTATEMLTDTATVSASETDPFPDNNQVSVTSTLNAPPSADSGGKSGGGSLNWLALFALAGCRVLRRVRRTPIIQGNTGEN
ncbi:MAG TPA: GlyGly-CTERM sorting domain-containing protein [Gammaproteobacteria bacterium]|nr:GlyGly-CTERM sorting domain-containing protein [Gammaproteobacteria bacterium]